MKYMNSSQNLLSWNAEQIRTKGWKAPDANELCISISNGIVFELYEVEEICLKITA